MQSWILALLTLALLSSPILAAEHGSAAPSASQSSATKHRRLNESDALSLISRLPEVKAWKHQVEAFALKRPGLSAHIALDREESGKFIIHVYEEVPDDNDSSHTATFNWYEIDKTTGKIEREF